MMIIETLLQVTTNVLHFLNICVFVCNFLQVFISCHTMHTSCTVGMKFRIAYKHHWKHLSTLHTQNQITVFLSALLAAGNCDCIICQSLCQSNSHFRWDKNIHPTTVQHLPQKTGKDIHVPLRAKYFIKEKRKHCSSSHFFSSICELFL